MKNILIKSFLIILSLSFFTSCEEDDSRFGVDSQSAWVQFTTGAQIDIAYGTTDKIVLPVKLYSAVNPGLDISYSIQDVVGSSAGVLVSNPGFMTVDSGSLEGNLVLDISTVGLSSTIEFDVTLTMSSRENVQIGLSDNSKPIVRRVKICPFVFSSSYTGVPTANLASGDVEAVSFSVNFVPTMNTNEFTLTTTWGPNYVAFLTGNPAYNGMFLYPSTLSVDTSTGEVNVVGGAGYANGGTGTMDACSGEITIVITDGLFGSFPTTVVFTPN
jgi:hypothetical protein